MSADGERNSQSPQLHTDQIANVSGPRSLARSRCGAFVCIGCSDGRLLIVSHRGASPDVVAQADPLSAYSRWTGGVRSATEVAARDGLHHWLVGHLDGQLEWLAFQAANDCVRVVARRPLPGIDAEQRPELVYVGRLGDEEVADAVLISHARSSSWHDEQDALRIFQLVEDQGQFHLTRAALSVDRGAAPLHEPLERVRATLPLQAAGGRGWLLLTHNAQVWMLARHGDDSYRCAYLPVEWRGVSQQSWTGPAGPCLVMDAVPLGGVDASDARAHNKFLVTTDIGMFMLQLQRGPDGAFTCSALAMHAAGARGTLLAVTSFCERDYVYAFCSDSRAQLHWYRTLLDHASDNAQWQRVHVDRARSPAFQALATTGSATRVWQMSRDHRVSVSRWSTAESDRGSRYTSLSAAQEWLAAQGRESAAKRGIAVAAFVAELFEPQPYDAKDLWRFLREPSATLARDVLLQVVEDTRCAEDIERCIELWTQALVGSIHRLLGWPMNEGRSADDEIEDLALGVIRWLHSLETQTIFDDEPLGRECSRVLADASRTQIFNVRRWVFYAPTHGSRAPRVARQVDRLQREQHVGYVRLRRRQREEQLALESQLFAQRVDDEAQVELEARGVACDAVGLALRDARKIPFVWVAVLWRHEAVRLFRIDHPHGLDAELKAEALVFTLGQGDHAVESSDAARVCVVPGQEFGRKLAFWQRDGQARLAWSVRTSSDASEEAQPADGQRKRRKHQYSERLMIYQLDPCGAALVPDEPLVDVPLSMLLPESTLGEGAELELCSLHSLGDDLLALGLRTSSGARIVVIQPAGLEQAGLGEAASAGRPWVRASAALHGSYGNARDAVTAIASVPGIRSGTTTLLAGASDGRVWCTELPASTDPACELQLRLCGQLSVGVSTVTAKQITVDDAARLRVFAGGADGTLVAWQELSSRDFAILWAMREQQAVVQITAVAFDDGVQDHPDPRSTIMAVTRDGRAVLVNDEPSLMLGPSYESEPGVLGKPRIPGQRIERFKLRSSVFAATLVHVNEHGRAVASDLESNTQRVSASAPSATPAIRLCVVSSDSTVRLLGLHAPKRSTTRHERFDRLCKSWGRALAPLHAGDDDHTLERTRLRTLEALRAASPELYLLPVRAFLPVRKFVDSALEARMNAIRKEDAEWFPVYLQPYVRAVRDYRKLRELLGVDEAKPTLKKDEFDATLRRVCSGFASALRCAVELRDKLLFQEILKAVLEDFTRVVIKVSQDCERSEKHEECLYNGYDELLAMLDEACRSWIAIDMTTYARVQITRIKSVANGRVLRHVTDAIERVQRPSYWLRRIIQVAVEHVERLLTEEHELVPLETLRALNLAMVRATWLGYAAGRDPAAGERSDSQRPPLSITPLLGVLDTFAERAAVSADDVLAHEIARSYALTPLLSPSDAAAAAFGLRAARLPEHILSALEPQFELLLPWIARRSVTSRQSQAELESRPPPVSRVDDELGRALSLFREVTRPRPTGSRAWDATRDRLRALCQVLDGYPDWSSAFEPLAYIVKSLCDLADTLEYSPEDKRLDTLMQLSMPPVQSVVEPRPEKRLSSMPAPPTPFEHFAIDRKFWSAALSNLKKECKSSLPPQAATSGDVDGKVFASSEAVVDPALVLAGTGIARWARAQRAQLERHYRSREIHDPHYSIYDQALSYLGSAATKLPASSAVKRTLVAGVLDHHLLERLDDHVFHLWETAHTLDPDATRSALEPEARLDRRVEGTRDRFAHSLALLLREAQTVPKNLRTLYELIVDDDEKPARARSPNDYVLELGEDLAVMFAREFRVEASANGPGVKGREARLLRLVVRELRQNRDDHGSAAHTPQLFASPMHVSVRMRLHENEQRRIQQQARLHALCVHGIRGFLHREPNVSSSSGMGLYLASLAAASVRYQLSVEFHPQREPFYVTFKLERSSDHGP